MVFDVRELVAEAAVLGPRLVTLRRDIHRRPELGLELSETLARVLDELADLELETHLSATISSAVIRIPGNGPGSTVVLRADLDALALREDSGEEFASELPGRMHACGHDLHAAIGVGAVRLLHAHRGDFAGEVLFFFQPGEEGDNGADRMLDEGALSLATGELAGAYAVHVTTELPLGVFTSRPGPFMAGSATLDVTITGAGGHGSAPQLARDPNQVVAEIMTGLQTMVTRRFSAFDPVIITVGWMRGGIEGTNNVIPNSAAFGATVRTFSSDSLANVETYSRELVEGIAAAYGVRADIEFLSVTEPLINDPTHAAMAEDVAVELFGSDRYRTRPTPMGGAEDFAIILKNVPGAFVFVGACPPELDPATAPYNHSNLARFDDSVVPDAAAYLAAVALTRLSHTAS